RIQHSLEVEGGPADDLEHVGGGGLLLQRIAQLVEQPRVLDGDYRLRGEVLEQLDLSLGEGTHLLAVDDDGADEFFILEHRHSDKRTRACLFDGDDTQRLARSIDSIRLEIRDMEHLLFADNAAETGVRAWANRSVLLPVLTIGRGNIVQMCRVKTF